MNNEIRTVIIQERSSAKIRWHCCVRWFILPRIMDFGERAGGSCGSTAERHWKIFPRKSKFLKPTSRAWLNYFSVVFFSNEKHSTMVQRSQFHRTQASDFIELSSPKMTGENQWRKKICLHRKRKSFYDNFNTAFDVKPFVSQINVRLLCRCQQRFLPISAVFFLSRLVWLGFAAG